MIRQRGEVYFGLNTGTEFAEQIEDRNLSVTMTFIFVGVFLILTLNIFLSNYMNLKLPLFICVPFYIIPLYFRQEPKLFFVFCLCGGFLGVHMLKNGRRHQVEKNARVYQAKKVIKKFNPDIVVGFGGYPSASALEAAASLKIKTMIHEQNSIIGLTNKILIKKVRNVPFPALL